MTPTATFPVNPFASKLRVFGEPLQTVEINAAPLEKIGNVVLPKLFALLKNEMLPATIGIDALRGCSSFMADGMKFGENSLRTSADMLGEIAGGLPGSVAGVSVGEALGAGVGALAAGPLGAIPGSAIGGFIGSIIGSVVGSYTGACISEHIARGLGLFGLSARHAES